jgi:hypothetical protein
LSLYEERIREVEHGCFAPSVDHSTSRGMGPSATVVYKRIASIIAAEQKDFLLTMNYT